MQYTVQPGDSLSLISKKFYGDFSKVDAIAQANNITDKNLIFPGIKLVLPDVVQTDSPSPHIEDAIVVDDGKGKKNTWIWWIVFGAAAGGGYYWYKRNQRKKKQAKS